MTIKTQSLFAVIALALFGIFAGVAICQGTPKYAHHYAFILDTSGSMEGRVPGSTNVFPEVKAAVGRFIDSLFLSEIDEVPTKVFVYTFDTGIQSRFNCELRTDADRRRLRDYINALTANGQNTYIYSSFRDAFREVQAVLDDVKLDPPNEHIANYYLFTDGLDNSSSGPNFGDVLADFSLHSNPQDFVFYCMLNVDPPAHDQQVFDKFQRIITPIKTLESPWQVQVKPSLIHLGNLWGKTLVTRKLVLACSNLPQNSPKRLTAKVEFPELDSLALGLLMHVKPVELPIDGEQELTFQLENLPEDLSILYKKDDYSGILALNTLEKWGKVSPSEIEVRFTFAPPCTVSLLVDDDLVITDDQDSVWNVSEPRPMEVSISVRRNVSAADREIGFNVAVTPKDPMQLESSEWEYVSKTLSIEGRTGTEVFIENVDDSLQVVVRPDRRSTEEIQIDLVLVLSSPQATLAQIGNSKPLNGAGQLTIPLGFMVPSKPFSPLTRILIVLAVILLIIVLAFSLYKVLIKDELPWEIDGRRKSPRGKVSCQLLNIDTGESLDVSKLEKKRIPIGRDGKVLTSFDGQAELFMEDGNLMLEVKTGAVSSIDPSTQLELPITYGMLEDGKIFKFGSEKIQVRINVASL